MTTVSYPIKDSDHAYWVYETDAHGYELPEMQTGEKEFVSSKLITLVSDKERPISDVFIAIHGWNTMQDGNKDMDIFTDIFNSIMKDYADFPPECDFNPLFIGVHWPSAPGSGRADELVDDESTFEENEARIERLCESLYRTDPPAAKRMRDVLDTLAKTKEDGAPGVRKSTLDAKMEKVRQSLIIPEVEDDEDVDEKEGENDTDPEMISPVSSGGIYGWSKMVITNVFRPLETKVFGQFLARSVECGENGIHTLMASLQEYAPVSTRFHVIAHSLGSGALCSSLIGGKGKPHLLRKKIHSATFLQGALGSHAFSEGEQFEQITRGLCPVAGPIVLTTSQTDRALKSYRFFHDLPIGLHGAVDVEPMNANVRAVGDTNVKYDFKPGELYNMIADQYIDEGDIVSGSHVDIFGPEIVRMMRQAIDCKVEMAQYALPTDLSREYFRERLPQEDVEAPPEADGSEAGGKDERLPQEGVEAPPGAEGSEADKKNERLPQEGVEAPPGAEGSEAGKKDERPPQEDVEALPGAGGSETGKKNEWCVVS